VDTSRHVDWSESREAFDRAVEALLQRIWATKTDGVAYAIDGRGGDGGLDVFVSKDGNPDEPTHVYQLKFFPQGMSGGFKKRRDQVKRSFQSVADKSSLKFWTLVIPCNPTVEELKSVHSLRGGRDLRIDVMGQSKLDDAIAKYPDLLAAATRRPLLDVLKIASMESVGLSTGSDLAVRVKNLGGLVDGRSAFWGSSFRYENGTVTEFLYPKRPDAAEHEPLSIKFSTEFQDSDEALHQEFRSMLDYGSATPVRLPESVVKNISFSGPDWFARDAGRASIEIHPVELDTPVDVELLVIDDDDVALSTLQGSLTLVSSGSVGETLRAKFKGMTLTLKRDSEGVHTSMTYLLNDLTGTEAWRLLKLITSIASGARWRLERSGEALITLEGVQDVPDVDNLVPAVWVDLASDLAVVERELDLSFKMPFDISNLERVNLKVARMLLDGRVTCSPRVEMFTGIISGDLNEQELDRMTQPAPLMKAGTLVLSLLGRKIRLGQLRAYHPRMMLVDGEEIRAALLSGNAGGRKVAIKPQDSSSIRIWLDGRLPADARIIPERWNIPEIEALPGLEEAIRAAASTEAVAAPTGSNI
jgi:hypothetical protein